MSVPDKDKYYTLDDPKFLEEARAIKLVKFGSCLDNV